jgi:hypothetical protein
MGDQLHSEVAGGVAGTFDFDHVRFSFFPPLCSSSLLTAEMTWAT